MPCTTILVGKKASYDGSTIIARNDDGYFTFKKKIVVNPKDIKKKYKCVISHLEIELPDNPYRYTSTPNVDLKEGIWAAAGINEKNVGMSATETITSNPLVYSADPLVVYEKAKNKKEKDKIGGIGEEDLVVLVLPYINNAREGVLRLGSLLEQYGTYECNGIAFNDENECWWLETIGGHHWIAIRVKDEEVVLMPNQFGLDHFDLDDAFGKKENNLCSADLKEFIKDNFLDTSVDGKFNPRLCFGSHSDQDHIYNTPRAWYMGRFFCPRKYDWENHYHPESDDLPFSVIPERKVTIEDVKYILSSHYQGTEYDPYSGIDTGARGKYRSIGTATTDDLSILQIRGYVDEMIKGIEWVCFGPNPFNAPLPIYPNVSKLPKYLSNTTLTVDTNTFYWTSRLIACITDEHYADCIQLIDRYQKKAANKSWELIKKYDQLYIESKDIKILEKANQEIADEIKKIADKTLFDVLDTSSKKMKNMFSRKDN